MPTDDSFSVATAQVVCRALGLPFSQARYATNRDVQDVEAVELNNCEGGEEYPQLCGTRRYFTTNTRKTVSVECPTGAIPSRPPLPSVALAHTGHSAARAVSLTEGTDSFNGIINLYSDFQFRPVCANSWTEENSQGWQPIAEALFANPLLG